MPKLPPRPHTDGGPGRGRGRWSGIRAKLLILLLSGISLTLLADSWSDLDERMRTLDKAYDEGLLEPLFALEDSVQSNVNGGVAMATPSAIEAMFESANPNHKNLHIALTPLDAETGTPAEERTLVGAADLPEPPPEAELVVAPPRSPGGFAGHTAFYTAAYHGYMVRVAMLERELRNVGGRRYLMRVHAVEGDDERVAARQATLRREFQNALRILALAALLISLGVYWALQPLERLRASVRERHSHDLHPLDASDVPYEVAPLVDAVNIYISHYRELQAEQGGFLADAAHQLRTPLAIMMNQAGYALRERDPERLHEILRAIIAQLGRSRHLTDQLLSMAHADLAILDTDRWPLIDLNDVAREVVLKYLSLAHEQDQDLGWVDISAENIPGGVGPSVPAVPVMAQAAEIHEALANLVHNAILYTPPGGSITVGTRIQGNFALVEVSDSGPGIALEHRETVFQRFKRISEADTEDRRDMANGAGLGLSIARAYARRYGGDIVLSNAPQSRPGSTGLCASLQLPLAATPH
jgi:two-component system sensor histidine kinase TctE